MASFLAGLLTAWAAGQLALAVFFFCAYFLGRREREFLIFAALCASLSVATGGIAYDYFGRAPVAARYLSDQISHTGLVLAAAANLHFALRFARVSVKPWHVYLPYTLGALFIALVWSGAFWTGPPRLMETRVAGEIVSHHVGRASWIGKSFHFVGLLETVAATALLLHAFRRGRREAGVALIGISCILPAVAHDVGLASGLIKNAVGVLPHTFLLYAFGVAGALVYRYRVVKGELEQAAIRLQEKSEELRHSYAELRLVQNELLSKKQLAAVGELAAAIAHEVRNPLAVIVNAVAGLRRAAVRDEDRAMLLDIVDEEAARLARLVTDLLRFARPVSVKRSPVSLFELANRSRSSAMDGHQIVVQMDEDPDVHTVWVDPSLFRLVFDNLVENACQSMKGGGTVNIRVSRGELHGVPAVRIDIIDSGQGMEQSVMERALDPFFTTRPSGTGLGLPIVHRIIEAHGGAIQLESEEGTGTTVTLLLPLGEPAPNEEASELTDPGRASAALREKTA